MGILDRAVRTVVALVFVALVSVVSAQVLIRYVVGGSLTWSEEAVRFLFIWLCFLGMILAAERRAHISIRSLVDLLPERARRISELFADLVSMAFLLFVAWQSVPLITKTWSIPSPTAIISMGLVYTVVPLSMLLMLTYWIRNTLRRLREQATAPEGATGAEV